MMPCVRERLRGAAELLYADAFVLRQQATLADDLEVRADLLAERDALVDRAVELELVADTGTPDEVEAAL